MLTVAVAALSLSVTHLSWVAPPAPPAEDLGSAYLALISTLTPTYLKRLASERRDAFRSGDPFPHLVLDGLFPPALLRMIDHEHPEAVANDGCSVGVNTCFKGGKRAAKNVQHLKGVVDKEELMGPATRLLFGFLKSSVWVTFLEDLTDTNGLLPDPHYRGSGLHLTSHGGRLQIHADFNRYKKYDLRRRVNTFIFLNDEWPDDYGGHLELWNKALTQCKQRVLPVLGRFVVFQTTDFSYHGHPQPLPAPIHRVRRSIALYYFTNGCPSEQCLNNDCTTSHSTLWKEGKCQKCEYGDGNTCAAFPTTSNNGHRNVSGSLHHNAPAALYGAKKRRGGNHALKTSRQSSAARKAKGDHPVHEARKRTKKLLEGWSWG